MRILMAEDEAIIAMEFQTEIEDRKIGEVVIVSTVSQALGQLASRKFDWGVLDMNLTDGTVFPVADQLASQGARICFMSGSQIPQHVLDQYQAVAFEKPVSIDAVCEHLRG